MPHDLRPLFLIVAVVLLAARNYAAGVPPSTVIDRLTYIYEKDDTQPPRQILAALRQLNGKNIIATAIDKDSRTGAGDIPAQYAIAFEAAAGKQPCLVVQAGTRVISVVENPQTGSDVMDVVQ